MICTLEPILLLILNVGISGQLVKVPESESVSRSVISDSLRPHGLSPARLLHPWDFPSKNTGVGCHFLLQGIFPTQALNPCLLLCRQVLYNLSHQGLGV